MPTRKTRPSAYRQMDPNTTMVRRIGEPSQMIVDRHLATDTTISHTARGLALFVLANARVDLTPDDVRLGLSGKDLKLVTRELDDAGYIDADSHIVDTPVTKEARHG